MSTAPSTMFGANGDQYFIEIGLRDLKEQALWRNRKAVSDFNIYAHNAAKEAEGGIVHDPAKTELIWCDVDEAKYIGLFSQLTAQGQGPNGSNFTDGVNEQDAIVVRKIPMAPGATANIRLDGSLQIVNPLKPVQALVTSPIGASMGVGANGHEWFAVPPVARFLKDGDSWPGTGGSKYIMHVYPNPFSGFNYEWELIPAIPVQQTTEQRIAALQAELAALQGPPVDPSTVAGPDASAISADSTGTTT